jgi:hypothetical protein
MNRSAKLRCIFCCSFSKFSRYSLAVLIGVVLLSDSVGATRGGTELQIPLRDGRFSFFARGRECITVAACCLNIIIARQSLR